MSRLALIALLSLPVPAAAQEIVFSIGHIDACFADGGWTDCIGIAAERCMEATPDGYSPPVMSACTEAERAYWDKELNGAFQSLLAVERQREAARTFPSDPTGEAAAREMQRAWIAWRDATCTYETVQWEGGSGANGAWLFCLTRLSGEQTLYLRSMMAAG